MPFGKRQGAVGFAAQAINSRIAAPAINARMSLPAMNVGMPVAERQAVAGPQSAAEPQPLAEAPPKPSQSLKDRPFRPALALIVCGILLYFLTVTYGPDIIRDHRLAGTWQPAYDLRATDGKCKRMNFVVTFCSANIRSVAKPDQAPVAYEFMMLFASGSGEALVPVRSTKDRAAVSILYAAETELWNRTLSFVLIAGAFAAFCIFGLLAFRRAFRS